MNTFKNLKERDRPIKIIKGNSQSQMGSDSQYHLFYTCLDLLPLLP
jgi:hypothetical protein